PCSRRHSKSFHIRVTVARYNLLRNWTPDSGRVSNSALRHSSGMLPLSAPCQRPIVRVRCSWMARENAPASHVLLQATRWTNPGEATMYTRDAMITDVQCCQEQDTLQHAASLMWQHDCGSIPVLDRDNRPIGMLTDRDIAMAAMLNNCSLSDLTAKQVMGRHPIITCRTSSSLERCLALMEEHEIRRIPVVDEEGRLAGI